MPTKTAYSFHDLEIWQLSIQLVKDVYLTTGKFPGSEIYNLTTQMRRSAVSTPSNIAEGFRRHSSIEFKRYLNIALSSLAELETQTIIARELDYIDEETKKSVCGHIDHISRKIVNLTKKLRIN